MLKISLEKFVLEFYQYFHRIYKYDNIVIEKESKIYLLDKNKLINKFHYLPLSWITIDLEKDFILNLTKVSCIPKKDLNQPFLKERNILDKEYYIVIGNGEELYCPNQNIKEVKKIVEIFKNYEAYLRKQKMKKLK